MATDIPIDQQSITILRGVGPAMAERLEKLQIYTVQDALFHIPLRYEDRTRVVPIGSLQPSVGAVFEGIIEHAEVKFTGGRSKNRGRSRSRRMLLCYLSDGTGGILLRFFHFSSAQQQKLVPDVRLRCYGEPRIGANKLEVTHPEYRVIADDDAGLVDKTLTAIYPRTDKVSQGLLRSLVEQSFERCDQHTVAELLPLSLKQKHRLPDMRSALHAIHKPDADTDLKSLASINHPSQQRLIIEELLAHQLSLAKMRQQVRKKKALALPVSQQGLIDFRQSLAFDLTEAQQKVISEILSDMSAPQPMLRLLQGDVGSGKTVVAAFAALAVIENDSQIAIMAPTEILAVQHLTNFMQWFPSSCILLTGKDKGVQREHKLAHIEAGKASIVIGTHALFQEDVEFHQLAAVVVDEQHRFGVHQRLALSDKGKRAGTVPHQLIMTATPIPRSLAMTAYADLDYSVIDMLPAGRKPVSTVVLPGSRRDEVIQRIAKACESGEQAYWVCTLVEESEVLQCRAAEETAEQLHQELTGLRIGLVHGRMKQQQKDEVVEQFKQCNIDLLVATTVIEVGVDVPNASLMVIENAERLGLAQLHQLRGRVGRGEKVSACVLLYQPPLSANGKQRLAILRESNSGFVISEKDLELRGPGEVLGTRQTGLLQMRIADIVRDEKWLPVVKQAARQMLQEDSPQVDTLIRRWLGKAERYAEA